MGLNCSKKEIWKPILDYEKEYQVSNLGRVRSLERKRKCGKGMKSFRIYKQKIKSVRINNRGYQIMTLCKNGRLKTFQVHRLVAVAFINNPKKLPTVNHINGVKSDNRVENLEWASRSYQISHAHKMGLIDQSGTKNHRSKLSLDDLLLFEALVLSNYMNLEIAKIFGISKSSVWNIKTGKTYVLHDMRRRNNWTRPMEERDIDPVCNHNR